MERSIQATISWAVGGSLCPIDEIVVIEQAMRVLQLSGQKPVSS